MNSQRELTKEELIQHWIHRIHFGINEKRDINVSPDKGITIVTDLYDAPQEIKINKEITLLALLKYGEPFENIDELFKNSKDFVCELIKNNTYINPIYHSLPQHLQEDEEIFEKLIEKEISSINFKKLPSKIITNKNLMLNALVLKNIYKEIEKYYKNDKDIIACYMNYYPENFHNISSVMKNYIIENKELLLTIMKHADNYRYLPEKIIEEKEIIKLAIEGNMDNFDRVPNKLKQNRTFILELVKEVNISLAKLPKKYRADEEIVKEVVVKNGLELNNADFNLRKRKDMVLLASQTVFEIIDMVSQISQGNMPPSKYTKLLLETSLLDDEELMKIFLEKNPNNYLYISSRLKKDFDISFDCVKRESKNYSYLPHDMKNNWECIYAIYSSNSMQNTTYLKEPPYLPWEILKEIGEQNMNEVDYIRMKAAEQYALRLKEKLLVNNHNANIVKKNKL